MLSELSEFTVVFFITLPSLMNPIPSGGCLLCLGFTRTSGSTGSDGQTWRGWAPGSTGTPGEPGSQRKWVTSPIPSSTYPTLLFCSLKQCLAILTLVSVLQISLGMLDLYPLLFALQIEADRAIGHHSICPDFTGS